MKNLSRVNLLLACACVGFTQYAALAHASLDHADPKVGSEISKPPAEVKIWFSEEIEPAFSTIQVLDAAGKQIDKKDTRRDAKDKKLLVVSVPDNLPPGVYKVTWKAVAADTHTTTGDFKFTVKPKE